MFRYGVPIVLLGLLLAAGAAQADDPSLQEVLDTLGYSIDVDADEVFVSEFEAVFGSGAAAVLAQYTQHKGTTEFGWYSPDDPGTLLPVFPADPNGLVGKSNTFHPGENVVVGFYISIADQNTWYTDDSLNSDAAHHCKVFPTIIDDQVIDWSYILAWEDQLGLGEADYQDLVVRLDGFSVVPEPGLVSLFGLSVPEVGIFLHTRRRTSS